MKPVRFHPDAQVEMVESARYYERQREGLGGRFLEAVHTSIRRIQLSPSAFQRIGEGTRRCCVRGFPFGVAFRERPDHLQIVAVIHFSRDPDYWQGRT
jgi:hypothetical protein